MTKIVIWILVIGVVIGGGVMLHRSSVEKNNTSQNAGQDKGVTATSPSEGKKMSFSAFLKYDKSSYRCTVDQYLSDMDSDGVVYVDGGNVRGDFSTIAEGQKVNTSFLMKDGWQYVWMKGASTGFKLHVQSDSSEDGQGGSASGTYSWSADQIGEYNCEPWEVQTGFFTPPSTVTFTDMSASMKGR